MIQPSTCRRSTALLLLLLLLPTAPLPARQVTVEHGEAVFAELLNDVSSKRRETRAGDIVRARVVRDVIVDGATIVRSGEEMILRVRSTQNARILGRKGRLELEPLVVRAVDGRDLRLDGSYCRTGRGRKLATATLAILVAWPFAFLNGKNAVVPEGTLIEARTEAPATFDLADPLPIHR